MFLQFKDIQGNNRQINMLFDKFPLIVNDGYEEWLTNTVDFLMDNDGDEEVIEALKAAFKTREEQQVGMGFSIRLF